MNGIRRKTRVMEGCNPASLPIDELLAGGVPVVLKGLVKNWGLTRAGIASDAAAMDYLSSFYNDKPLAASFGPPEIDGRLAYTDDLAALNFAARRVRLSEVFEQIQAHKNDPKPPTVYIGSTVVESCFPGFRQGNDLGFAAHGLDPAPSIWIGNHTVASAHYDAPNNLACVVVGRRRFTMFPPEQIFNLYPGPLEPTPGGQAISLVDLAKPDLEKYPRFREAANTAEFAEMEPGDAVFIPSMWWHHVEALSSFNTLVNYWWSSMPGYIPTPMHALYHAIWALRSRPESEKKAWRDVFEYYVFGSAEQASAHLPPSTHGILGPIDDDRSRGLRAMLLHKLNR
jgi:hypothetical protein